MPPLSSRTAFLVFAVAIASSACWGGTHDVPYPDEVVTTSASTTDQLGGIVIPVDASDAVKPDDLTNVGLSRETPTALELVEQDAKALDGEHSRVPEEADDVSGPQARAWYHHAIGLVDV